MNRFLVWINIVAVIVTLVVNGLANIIPFNGQTTAAISDKFPVYFVPAGYVFAIWGVIYIGLIAFGVYQALPRQRDNPRLKRIGYLFALSCLANSVWIPLWHYEFFPLTVVVMLALLLLLIAIYVRLDIGRRRVTAIEKWCVDIPFSIYLGWISVATIANITDLLYYWKWDGFGINPQWWAVLLLMAASAISLAMSVMRRDIAFLLVIIWAFAGIADKQASAPLVANAAWLMTALVSLMLLGVVYRRVSRNRPAAA